MGTVIDRRTGGTGKKFTTSRDRFMKRNKKQIRDAIDRSINDSDIKDIGKGGTDVTVPKDGVHEPGINHGKGGIYDKVLPGNDQYNVGDKAPRPDGGGGGGTGPGEPGDGDDGEDDFTFALTEEEFLNILFEDLELPNLDKKNAEDAEVTTPVRKGFITDGSPHKMDLKRSKRTQIQRTLAIKKPLQKEILANLLEQYSILSKYAPDYEDGDEKKYEQSLEGKTYSDRIDLLQNKNSELYDLYSPVLSEDDKDKLDELGKGVKDAAEKISLVPTWNKVDLRYRNHEQKPTPTTKALMVCMMDVSGSMDEHKKANAKLFYMLLYRFLKRKYRQVEVAFIRHTTTAEEVDEQTFFYDRKSGGTKVSTAIEKMQDIIDTRYSPADWNIYGAQASDGENWGGDTQLCVELLEKMMPQIQAYFYTEVVWPGNQRWGEALWDDYEALASKHSDKFFMGLIEERKDIWPVFKDFFQKRDNNAVSAPSMRSSLNPA